VITPQESVDDFFEYLKDKDENGLNAEMREYINKRVKDKYK